MRKVPAAGVRGPEPVRGPGQAPAPGSARVLAAQALVPASEPGSARGLGLGLESERVSGAAQALVPASEPA